jgi:hypothetical protein
MCVEGESVKLWLSFGLQKAKFLKAQFTRCLYLIRFYLPLTFNTHNYFLVRVPRCLHSSHFSTSSKSVMRIRLYANNITRNNIQ